MNESISVSALNRYVKLLLETDEILSQVWVEGEISGLVIHQRSGHMYFTLKDSEAAVKSVMFRSSASRLRFIPQDGMQIVARCRVSLYERDGAFQLYVEELIPRGVGGAAEQLRQLTEKLEREGLFDPDRKRPLVRYPKKIAVVTSESGAAFHDIVSVIGRRWPFTTLVLYPVNVQGALAVQSMLDALAHIARDSSVDEVILTRGGGSKEDLWIFNEESLVRAIAALDRPLLSAVGHEIDTTLVDCVADMRAATPSAAAELAVPDAQGMLQFARNQFERTDQLVRLTLTNASDTLQTAREALQAQAAAPFERQRERLDRTAAYCEAVSPLNVVMRGYSIAMLGDRVISSVSDASTGDRLSLRMRDGQIHCAVERIETENEEPEHGI